MVQVPSLMLSRVKITLQKVQVSLVNVCSRYSKTFPLSSPWVIALGLWSLKLPNRKILPGGIVIDQAYTQGQE